MRLMDLLNWIFAPGDWETIICPKLVGSAGEVTVELCGVEAQFSPRRNARCLKGIESSDFALLLQMEAKRQLLCVQPARAERRMWCEGCKAMLSPQYDLQSCEFTVSPEVFADFEVGMSRCPVCFVRLVGARISLPDCFSPQAKATCWDAIFWTRLNRRVGK